MPDADPRPDGPAAPGPHPGGLVYGQGPPPTDGPYHWIAGGRIGFNGRGEKPPKGPGFWARDGDKHWTRLPEG